MQRENRALSFHRRLALLPDAHDLIQHSLRHFPLRGLRNGNDFFIAK